VAQLFTGADRLRMSKEAVALREAATSWVRAGDLDDLNRGDAAAAQVARLDEKLRAAVLAYKERGILAFERTGCWPW